MRAREHMGHVLEATGLYRLTGDTPVDWELYAYGVGFARLEERFQAILEDMFPQTAGREKLAQWETLFRPQPAEASWKNVEKWFYSVFPWERRILLRRMCKTCWWEPAFGGCWWKKKQFAGDFGEALGSQRGRGFQRNGPTVAGSSSLELG